MDETANVFGSYGQTDQVQRHWLAAGVASLALYGGLLAVAAVLGTAAKNLVAPPPSVDVTFVEKVAKPEPPPPPPPEPVIEKPKPPPAAAPVIPKDMKVRKLEAPPPPKELVAPKEMPQAVPEEADPSEDKGIAVYGEPGDGDPAGLEGGSADGVAGGQVGAIALPEDADPPLPVDDNAPPAYPQEARAAGKTGMVILKIVIRADGSVDTDNIQVMRGEEPFVSSALAAVKTWRYEPARYQGQAITVYRIIQIPFKLTV